MIDLKTIEKKKKKIDRGIPSLTRFPRENICSNYDALTTYRRRRRRRRAK